MKERTKLEVAKESAPGTDEKASQELLNRLRKRNYIPDTARDKYKEAFLREFKKTLGRPDPEENTQGLTIKILGQGCSRCDGLEREIIDVLAELKLEAEVRACERHQGDCQIGRHGGPWPDDQWTSEIRWECAAQGEPNG